MTMINESESIVIVIGGYIICSLYVFFVVIIIYSFLMIVCNPIISSIGYLSLYFVCIVSLVFFLSIFLLTFKSENELKPHQKHH